MSVVEDFVAFDLETTDLDPERGRIIEIGAVKFEDGETAERFSQLVNPGLRIPLSVRKLTGISDSDVKDAPPEEEAVQGFLSFVGEFPLVAHNAEFDLSFLAPYSPGAKAYDSLILSRIALPCLRDHRLETLASFFTTSSEDTHRALADAQVVAGIFMKLLEILEGWDYNLLWKISRASAGLGWGVEDIFSKLTSSSVRSSLRRKIGVPKKSEKYLNLLWNVGGKATPYIALEERKLDVEAVRSAFEPGGILAGSIEGYEEREQQINMSEAVSEAFNNGEILAVEAGTGVGKSMAYLLPAVEWGTSNGRKVVISTNTKNLQEQLFFKDIPQLSEALGLNFKSVLLKGRGNYLCLNRWQEAISEPGFWFTLEERAAILSLIPWAGVTETGDVSENSGFLNSPKSRGAWAKVCSDTTTCLGQKCPNRDRCFVAKVRGESQDAHLVVVNHSLLFSDLSSESKILEDYECLILDEAHNLEKVAIQYLSVEMHLWRVRSFVGRLYRRENGEFGLLASLKRELEGLEDKNLQGFRAEVERICGILMAIWRESQVLFQVICDSLEQRYPGSDSIYVRKLRYRDGSVFENVRSDISLFLKMLDELSSELSKFLGWIVGIPSDSFPSQDSLISQIEGYILECSGISDNLIFLTSAEEENYVYWAELPPEGGAFDLRLYAAPLDIAERLSEEIYSRMRTVVFTSATLTVGDSFDYFVERLGLALSTPERMRVLSVGSPFDYQRQVMACIPTFMPSPRSPSFQTSVDDILKDVSVGIRRGTMALYTSYGMLNRSYSSLKGNLEIEGILLLGQGSDGSRSSITSRFKDEPASVLLGTESFWEGVDIPGEALEVLLIVKLPFAVPSEPVVQAIMEKLEGQGQDPFLNYSVPEAVIKFRQGFGRLIRSKSDRGVVIILDKRIVTSGYGEIFLKSLPVEPTIFRSKDEMVSDIEEWFFRP